MSRSPDEFESRQDRCYSKRNQLSSYSALKMTIKTNQNYNSKPETFRLTNIFITLSLLWPIITSGALLSNAQYSLQACDSTRLIRCQQDVLRDMQIVSLNAASIQQPLAGPPYSPKQQFVVTQQQQRSGQLLANPSTCRLVRSNLDCLLVTTPVCYDQGIQIAQNTDIILRAKRFLEQNGCNEPDTTWQSTFCFRSPEVRSCEERYGFTSFGATAPLLVSNTTACLAYHAFKYCVDTHLRLNCKVHEMDMENEYLIDKASDLAWRCPVNVTSSVVSSNYHQSSGSYSNDPYRLSNQPGSVLNPSVSTYNNYPYEQRPTYVGSTNGLSSFNSFREQSWERFRNPLDETRYGISRYPSGAGTGEVFDRLVAANNGFDTDTSDCPVKAAPYARECEDTLMEQHRLARDSRDGNELQRRMCCALFQFRDCISRVVLDRCADSSPTAVEILMGVRRREMTLTCRGFNRDVCSGAIKMLSSPIAILIALMTSYFTYKHANIVHQ